MEKIINDIVSTFFNKTFFTFVIIGVINTVNNLLIYLIFMNLLKVNYILSMGIAFVFSACISYLLNTHFTFNQKKNIDKFVKFFLVNGTMFFFTLFCGYLFVDILHLPKNFASLFSSACGIPISFLLMKLVFIKENKYVEKR